MTTRLLNLRQAGVVCVVRSLLTGSGRVRHQSVGKGAWCLVAGIPVKALWAQVGWAVCSWKGIFLHSFSARAHIEIWSSSLKCLSQNAEITL